MMQFFLPFNVYNFLRFILLSVEYTKKLWKNQYDAYQKFLKREKEATRSGSGYLKIT